MGLLQVPKDVLLLIFAELDSDDLKHIPLVCKRFASLNLTHLWHELASSWFETTLGRDVSDMVIPSTKNYHEWQSLVQLANDIGSGVPCISADYAVDLIYHCLNIFHTAVSVEVVGRGKSYTNITELHYIEPEVLVEVTPIMHKIYGDRQQRRVTVDEIMQQYQTCTRYQESDFGGYYYAWGDVVKKHLFNV